VTVDKISNPLGMTIRETNREITARLKRSGVESPELEADWLLEHFTKLSSAERLAHPERILDQSLVQALLKAVERREYREPLAYILGERDFYGITFRVSPGVLIPRPDTERLVEWALTFCARRPGQKLEILDIGTGSGCIGLTLLHHFDNAQLTAIDISDEALAIANENARQLQLSERVRFLNMDGARLAELGSKFDLVVANPPYIANDDPEVEEDVRRFEPHSALFAAGNGLKTLTEWTRPLKEICKENAAVGFEIGYQQGPAVLALFDGLGIFKKTSILKDYGGNDRVVCGER
jgi:release factor glutamine methyltransferase